MKTKRETIHGAFQDRRPVCDPYMDGLTTSPFVEDLSCKKCLRALGRSLDEIGGYTFARGLDAQAQIAARTAALDSREARWAVEHFNDEMARALSLMKSIVSDFERDADPANVERLLQGGYGVSAVANTAVAVAGRIGSNLRAGTLFAAAQRVERAIENGMQGAA